MIIREVNINDADALSDIYKYYVDNFSYSFEYVAPSAEEFAERIADISEKFPFFVCEDNGEIIGFAYAHKFKERKAYQWVCETSIYAKNGCTQKGVGKLLYENLNSALKQQGFVKAFAVLGCPNEGSEIFHQKMGFSFVATLPNIGYKLGSWHDIKYYVLELNPFCDDMTEPLEYHQIKQEKETYETDEERQARIYPIILSEYNPAWPKWYAEEKANLERLIGVESIVRISHYGSTSVPGLTAKPTVDILLEINENTDINKLIAALPPPEYICLNEAALTLPTPPPHLMFLKGYLPDGFADKVYHIHVRYSGDPDELYFRDYLIAHPETAAEYAALKARLHKGFEHNRDGYTNAKTAFIREVTEKARKLCAFADGNNIRLATESDLHYILNIDPFRRIDIIRHAIGRGDCYIAVYDGIIKGFAIINYTFFDNAFIELLLVVEKYRRSGIGSALLNYLFAECKTQKLFTSTNKSNEPMRKLLGKAGFTYCGEIDALDEGDPEMFFFRKVVK